MDPSGEDTATEKFQCSLCSSSFKRPEHLKRHQRIHDAGRRFTCTFCSKSFARSDILARHSSIHTHPARLAEPPSHNGPRRRACIECAKSREKCTKGQPCSRCSLRSLVCLYPNPQRRKRRNTARQAERSDSVSSDDEDEETVEPIRRNNAASTVVATDIAHSEEFSVSASMNDANRMDDVSPLRQGAARDGYSNLNLNVASGSVSLSGANDTPYNPTPGFSTQNESGVLYPANSVLQDQATPYPMFTVPLDTPTDQSMNLEGADFVGFGYPADVYDPSLDFPINWLPANDAVDIDYTSILGLGISSMNVFPNTSTDFSNVVPPSQISNSLSPNSIGSEIQVSVEGVSRSSSNAATTPGNSVSNTSHHSQSVQSRRAGPGGLYATSTNGARVPCTVRSKRPAAVIYGAKPLSTVSSDTSLRKRTGQNHIKYNFRDLSYLSPSATELGSARLLTIETYELLTQQFERLCLRHDDVYPSFSGSLFPLKHHIELFVHLYFEYFDPILPIIHNQLCDINNSWQLALAIAAIGCQYTQTQDFADYIPSLHEFLRRALSVECENHSHSSMSTASIQAYIVGHIALSYYGSTRQTSLARSRHTFLCELVDSCGLLSQHPEAIFSYDKSTQASSQQLNSQEQQWKDWVEAETRRRTGYAIWLLDCMAVYHFESKPLLSLEMAAATLPQDNLWEAAGCSEWAELAKTCESNPSLTMAAQNIFIDKTLRPDLGEYSRVLILHGVYSELFRVKSYFSRGLSFWTPSVQRVATEPRSGASSNLPDNRPNKWLPEDPTLASWRNASLDCVDVLHWAANGKIAQLAGAEHPTVLHLHMSRVVLLSPYGSIRKLALSIASLAQMALPTMPVPSREDGRAAEREILQWAQRDEHKARLCVLHCGCFLWHIRRYSTMAFYEPASVFLAILTLWAYSSYASRASAQHNRRNHGIGGQETRSGSASRRHSPEAGSQARANLYDAINEPFAQPSSSTQFREPQVTVQQSPASNLTVDDEPTFIRLDRPNDDEMVQLFVRSGRPSIMRAYITGVGDICSPKGPARILAEGRKILNAISIAWGRTRDYVSILEAVEKATSNMSSAS